jgi:hypothetical protein
MENEFWKQMAGSLVRKVITIIGGALIGQGLLTEEQTGQVFSTPLVEGLIGVVLVLGGVLWSYAKVKFNINFVKAAITAPPSATIPEVKEIALGRETTQTSV